jgi:hypothetical protein
VTLPKPDDRDAHGSPGADLIPMNDMMSSEFESQAVGSSGANVVTEDPMTIIRSSTTHPVTLRSNAARVDLTISIGARGPRRNPGRDGIAQVPAGSHF